MDILVSFLQSLLPAYLVIFCFFFLKLWQFCSRFCSSGADKPIKASVFLQQRSVLILPQLTPHQNPYDKT